MIPIAPAPPAPKQFTDEELKQTYGIHLATRLQSDQDGKGAKWADIDDDDEDWAPETMEWKDGTKVALPHNEELPEAVEELVPESKARSTDGRKTPSVTSRTASPIPRTGGKSGLVLKGAPEKPSLVAKPTGPPQPAKSPWAPIPPINPVSPVPVNANPLSQSRFGKPPHGLDSMPPPPSPAKEIAADDFNRSWRDNQNSSSRELYNSHSGQYEPVGGGRRGSARHEQQFRHPSVLQRPGHDLQGPAEPSAAFQTHRSSQENALGRRRTSSNVSGGSGSFGRRVSFSKGQDFNPADQKRGSIVALSHSPASPRDLNRASPVHGHFGPHSQAPQGAHQALNDTSPNTHQSRYAAPSRGAPVAVNQTEVIDLVALQEKTMRDAREQARKRREQEEKEEAEKKERLRLKLAAMGFDERPKESQKPIRSTKDSPTFSKSLTLNQSPPKPPIVQATEEPKQYGMMKLHPVEPMKRTGAGPLSPGSTQDAERMSHISQNSPEKASLPRPHGNRDVRLQNGQPSNVEQPVSMPSQSESQDEPWKHVPAGSDKFTSWGTSGMTTHTAPSSSLWGPPSNEKAPALGNGTFDRGFSRFPARQVSQQQFSPPGPIGAPVNPNPASDVETSIQSTRRLSDGTRTDIRTLSTQPPNDVRYPIRRQNGPHSNGPGPIRPPGPIAPPILPSGLSAQQRDQALAGWASLPERIASEDLVAADKVAEDVRTGRIHDRSQVNIRETWRQVTDSDDPTGARQLVSVNKTDRVVSNSSISGPAHNSKQSVFTSSTSSSANNGSRGSRFFPQSNDHHQLRQTDQYDNGSPPSPPPPTAQGHPAFDGDAARPNVALPPGKIIVRLPGSAVTPVLQPSEISRQKEPVSPPISSDKPSGSPWQAKISALLGPKASQSQSKGPNASKYQDYRINSATKAPLEVVASHVSSAKVSLPVRDHTASTFGLFKIDDSKEVTSKPTEEALMEEREFGSLPTVKIPTCTAPSPRPVANTKKGKFLTKPRFVEATSAGVFLPEIDPKKPAWQIRVRLPGWDQQKLVKIPRKTSTQPLQQRKPSSNQKKPRDPKTNREGSGSYGSGGSGGPNRSVSHGSPAKTPFNGASNWSRRVSEAVV
jgi:hypothetical protein